MAEAALLLPPEAAAERDAREKLSLWDGRPDSMAPLTDRQTDSVLELKAAVENLPVPAELPIEDVCSLASQSLPIELTAVVPDSTEDILLKGFTSLGMEEERIETAQQIEYERKKKEDGKRARADKQHVLDMLFSAFEKHQYYNLKDLVDITKQPVGYLKEILKEIGIQNVKGIHKNTWELKPEYRHYQTEEKSD